MSYVEYAVAGGTIETSDDAWKTMARIYLEEGETAYCQAKTIVKKDDLSEIGYANRMFLIKRAVGGSITIVDNHLIQRYKDGAGWDSQFITDTSYCEFQLRGDVGDNLTWHTDITICEIG